MNAETITCPDCNGRGVTFDEITPGVCVPELCSTCDGTREIEVEAA